MSSSVVDAIERVARSMLLPSARRQLAQSAMLTDPVPRRLVAAVGRVLNGDEDEAESQWLTRLAGLRQSLESSRATIEVVDFGAGGALDTKAGSDVRPKVNRVSKLARVNSKSDFWGRLLFHIAREFRPRRCIELGTCLGMSSAYVGAAVEMNGVGRLITLEGAPKVAALARENLRGLDLAQVHVITGEFACTLPEVLPDAAPIEMAFIDGHHTEEATLEYFAQLAAVAAEDAVFVLDDIRWSRGMRRAWKTVSSHERVSFVLDLFRMGVCVLSRGGPRSSLRVRLV